MFGDVTFTRRVCTDLYGNTFVPLDEAVDLPRNSRVSPHAREFVLDAASEGSYAKAAHFMEAAGGCRVERVRPIRFGCVAKPRAFWTQGMAGVATRFDMSNVRRCHAGFDGEAWCKRAADYLPAAVARNHGG